MAQFDLFGGGPAEPPAAAGAPEFAAAARRLDPRVRLGTSSWNFAGWQGLVYPRGLGAEALRRDGLTHYARCPLLGAAGVDRSYYGPLARHDFRAMAERVGPDFRFLVKAHRDLTTPWTRGPGPARFLDAGYAARAVVAPTADGLGGRLGALVFQFPPLRPRGAGAVEAFGARLGRFLAELPAGVPYRVELRDAPLYVPAVLDRVRAAGAGPCFTVHPGAPPLDAQRAAWGPPAGEALVLRWNLRRDREYAEAREAFAPFDRLAAPDPATRRDVASLVVEALGAGGEALVIANNKAEGSAPLTLLALAGELAG